MSLVLKKYLKLVSPIVNFPLCFNTGLVGFTKSLAKEVAARGIRVNLAAPGFIVTDMTSHTREKDSTFAASIPLQRYGEPSEVAEAIRFLVESPYITGQV